MKKSLSILVLAAALLGAFRPASAEALVLYTEDWGTTNGGGSFAAVGWSLVEPSSINPPYIGFYSAGTPTDSSSGSSLPAETAYYTSLAAGQNVMFYTVAGAGAGSGGDSAFNAIDPTQFKTVTLSVEASDEGSTATNYFAVQVGGAWYVSTTALTGSDPSYPQFTLASTPYTTAASAWNQLTINPNSVTIGSVAPANLSGPITGVGIVQVGPGGWNYNEIVISATPSPTVYTEDWGTTNGGGSFAAVGWILVEPSSINPPYIGFYSAGTPTDSSSGNALPAETAYYTGLAAGQNGMFYTTAGSGAGSGGDSAFNAIDPTQHTDLTFSVEASDEGSSATNYFAVQVGDAWYVSATALMGSQPSYPQFTLTSTPYTTLASAWNQLTINANSVTIGPASTANLSGPITGVGIVQVGPGGWNYNEIVISDLVPSTSTPPSATIYSEDWGTPFYNTTGTENGAADLADVGWSASGIAYTGSYTAPGSIDPVTGVTFPPPPLGNINGTNNALYASLDGTDGYIGIFYTTDTNGPGTDGDTSFADIDPVNYPRGVVFNMESQFNSTTHATNYFAVQIGAVAGLGGQWYVSTNGITNNEAGNPYFTLNSLVFNPRSNYWDNLTFQEGALNPSGSVTIGGLATNNLSGPITGIGVVLIGDPAATGAGGYGINFATFSVTTPLVNSGNIAPKIDAPGFSQTAYAGATASFAVDAYVGKPPLTYTWTLTPAVGSPVVLNNGATGTGSFIIGASSNVLTISNAGSSDAGSYSAEVGNLYGADYSTNYTTNTLTVNPLPSEVLYAETFPFVGPFPTGESPAAVGWFGTVASGDNPNRLDESGSLYSYENGPTTTGFFTSTATDVPGLSGLPFTAINPSAHPSVSFRATIADPTGDTTAGLYFAVQMAGGQWYASSSAIQLAATPAIYNIYGLQFSPAMQGWNTLTVGASSATIGSPATADLTGNITGAGIVFVVVNAAAEYYLADFELVTNSTPPVLPSYTSLPNVPYPQTVYAGGGASFYFTEAGSLPLTNNWKFNGAYLSNGLTATGSIVSGAQTTELTIQNASGADGGPYDPTVSNPAGTNDLASSPNDILGPPALTVNPPPLGLIYSESFPLYQPATANQPFSIIGWTNQSDVPNRIFQIGSAEVGTGAAYAYEGIQTNSLFYASTASDTGFSGLPFIAFDPANYPAGSLGFSTSLEAGNTQYTNASASFAVEQGGQWYAMATPIQPTNSPTLTTSAYTTLGQTYSPLASQWKTLTFVGTAGVIVGGAPAQNLSGPITAAGLLFQHFGTSGADLNYDSFTIQATGTGNLNGGLNIGPLVNGSATLTWVGNPAVSLQSSMDLIHWAAVPNTAGNHMLTVSAIGSQVFYRVAGPSN